MRREPDSEWELLERNAGTWAGVAEVEPQGWWEERDAGMWAVAGWESHQGWWEATPRAAAWWDATCGTWAAAEWTGADSWSSRASTWAGAASAEPTEGVPVANETVVATALRTRPASAQPMEVVVVAKETVATRVLRTRPTSAQGTEAVVDATETEVTTVLRTSLRLASAQTMEVAGVANETVAAEVLRARPACPVSNGYGRPPATPSPPPGPQASSSQRRTIVLPPRGPIVPWRTYAERCCYKLDDGVFFCKLCEKCVVSSHTVSKTHRRRIREKWWLQQHAYTQRIFIYKTYPEGLDCRGFGFLILYIC